MTMELFVKWYAGMLASMPYNWIVFQRLKYCGIIYCLVVINLCKKLLTI